VSLDLAGDFDLFGVRRGSPLSIFFVLAHPAAHPIKKQNESGDPRRTPNKSKSHRPTPPPHSTRTPRYLIVTN
jgi:hypothetical protein